MAKDLVVFRLPPFWPMCLQAGGPMPRRVTWQRADRGWVLASVTMRLVTRFHRRVRLPLALAIVAACHSGWLGDAQPVKDAPDVCPESRNIRCVTRPECTLARGRECLVCQCCPLINGRRCAWPPRMRDQMERERE